MLGAALNVARPGHTAPPVGTRGPDVCSYPEVLCSQPTGPAMGPGAAAAASLLKLWMPGALDCDGSWSALAGLAGATSLAWLDASLSALEFPLVRAVRACGVFGRLQGCFGGARRGHGAWGRGRRDL